MKRLLIAAAGTGGHVFPALAVALELRARGWEVLWLGTSEGRLESKVVPAAGFELLSLPVQGLRGHGLLRKLQAPWQLLRAWWQCRQWLRERQVQLVLGFGGYVAGPVGVAARSLGIPLLCHEQNARAGLTNRQLQRFAQAQFVGFAGALRDLPKAEVVGNPLRAEVLAVAAQARTKQPQAVSVSQPLQLLVVGGSLGARALNEQVPLALAKLAAQGIAMQVVHQCGQHQLSTVQAAYQQAGLSAVTVVEFIDDMASAYAAADLVICRAGALTVAEIAAIGVAAIFVPLPHAVDDHQTANAESLVSVGAAKLVPQGTHVIDFNERLTATIEALLSRPERLQQMAAAARQAAHLNATAAVVEAVEQWSHYEG